MNKKIIATIVAGTLTFASLATFAGCGGENTEPEISGVKQTVTVESGTQFDALAGVTATDKEDGDLTSKIVVESIPALTFTDGKATPTQAGTYELTYSVTDSGNLSAEEYSTLTVTRHAAEATSLVKFNFANDAKPEDHGWKSSVGESATATAALKEGAYVFDITNPGNGDGDITLVKNVTLSPADYKIKIWAKSTKDTYMHFIAEDAGQEGWQVLGGDYNKPVGAKMSPVEVNFTLAEEKNTDLRIHLGKITPNGENPTDTTPENFTVTIDKIEIYKITGTETKTPLYTQDFAENADSIAVAAFADAAATVTHDNGVAKIEITAYPNDNKNWNIKPAISLGDTGIETGIKYYYSLKVTSQYAQSGDICVEHNETEWQNRASYGSFSVAAGETKTIEGSFTSEVAIDSNAVIKLYVGTPSEGVATNVLTIDDVVFGKLEGDKETEKTLDRFIAYGKGSQNEENPNYLWDTFNGTDEDNEKGVGTIWTEGGSLFYRIEEGSTTDWHNKFFFGYGANPLKLPADSYFTVKFTAKASKAVSCPMFLNVLGNWAPRVNETVNFTTEYQTFEFTTTETLVTEMNFELLFQFGSADLAQLGEVTIEFKDFEILQSVVS